MFCKSIKNTKFWVIMVTAGVVSFLFGIVGYQSNMSSSGDGDMLLGMFTGMGAVFTILGIIRLLYIRFAPAEKLKAEQIKLNDERNIQVLRAAYSVAYAVSVALFAVLAFVFVGLGYRVPAFITIGALWIEVIVFLISHTYFNNKM